MLNLLSTAMRYAQSTCVLGSTNKLECLINTNGYVQTVGDRAGKYLVYKKNNVNSDTLTHLDYFLKKSNNEQVPYVWSDGKEYQWKLFTDDYDPLESYEMVKMQDGSVIANNFLCILANNLVSSELRVGNCKDLSYLIYGYLWEYASDVKNTHHHLIKRIEILAFDELDHVMVVVNRKGESLHHWGDDAWVIDGWWGDGKIFQAQTLERKTLRSLKAYVLGQQRSLLAIPSEKDLEPLVLNNENRNISMKYKLFDSVEVEKTPFPKDIYDQMIFDQFSKDLLDMDLKFDYMQHRLKSKNFLNQIKTFSSKNKVNTQISMESDEECLVSRCADNAAPIIV